LVLDHAETVIDSFDGLGSQSQSTVSTDNELVVLHIVAFPEHDKKRWSKYQLASL
jgi:hypothetical protein